MCNETTNNYNVDNRGIYSIQNSTQQYTFSCLSIFAGGG